MRRGLTLIELMIVIAVMGIVLTHCWAPIGNAFARLREARSEVDAQQAVTRAFQSIRAALRAVPAVTRVRPDGLELPTGGRWRSIRRLPGGAGVRVADARGRGITFVFPPGFRVGPFQGQDTRYVTCLVTPAGAGPSVPMLWRCGP